jgi:hypothetical protein
MKEQEIHIDLNVVKSGKLVEFSYLHHLGAKIELLIKMAFGSQGLGRLTGSVRGTPSQVRTFKDALRGEKRYAQSFMKHGLSDSRTLNNRYALEKAISGFEKETGLKWPLK